MNLTELKQKFDTHLQLKYTSEDTLRSYKLCFNKFIFENSRIYRLSNNGLKEYFADYSKRYSPSYYNQMLSTVTMIYELLGQPRKTKNIPYRKDKPKNIKILSRDEIIESLQNIENLKHRCIIKVLYIGALRSKELLNIKLSDIDSKNNRIYINKGKGGKSRHIPICDNDLEELRIYFKKYRPLIYLFEGWKKGEKYSKGSLRNVVKKIDKRVHPHLLRHTALTNLVDDGHNLLKVQRFAGHGTAKSTNRYYHVTNKALQGMILRTN